MSDSDPADKKPSVPAWQAEPQEEENSTGKDVATTPTPESPVREETLEQAKKFLEKDEVKDAPTDKKIEFLESKGVRSEDIRDLLGVSRNIEASSDTPSEASSTKPPSSTTSSTSPNPSSVQASQAYARPAPTPAPIITYPEFLTTPQRPGPLITKPRLLTTLYAFGSLSAVIYGTSTYLVAPMIASLTETRLSLASTATTNLQKLINKLEGVVSTIPPYTPKENGHSIRVGDDVIGGEESEDEDPTELFHRDIGIQTSPLNPSDSSRPGSPTPDPETEINKQVSRISTLSKHISELVADSSAEHENTRGLEVTMGDLKESLDDMVYTPPRYSYGLGGGFGYDSSGDGKEKEDDEIAHVKASIRSVKGVLLSARSFPRGVAAGSGGVR